MKLKKEFIEKVEIQILKRLNAGISTEEILNEMRDSYAELFIESGVADGRDAIIAGKKLTLKIWKLIAENQNLNIRGF